MSKFSDLIQKKHEMMKVTMKVDPAACKNGEITHFKEYVGFVLAEKEFEKTYEKLLKQYTVQNEGFFDAVGGALKAIGKRLYKDITDPFKSDKYNPFVGQDKNSVDTTEAGQIINQIKNEFLDVNKKVTFLIRNKEISKSYKQLGNEDSSIAAHYGAFKKIFATKTESYKNSSFLNLISEATSSIVPRISRSGAAPRVSRTGASPRVSRTGASPRVSRTSTSSSTPSASGVPTTSTITSNVTPPTSSVPASTATSVSAASANYGDYKLKLKNFILKGISLTDINTQISVRNLKETFIPEIKSKIEEENKKRAEMRQEKFKSSANDVWSTLVQEVEKTFKPSRSKDALNQEKILWIFILAQPDQKVKLTYNPTKQISSGT